MDANIEGVPSAIGAELPLRGLDAEAVESAAYLLNQPLELNKPSSRTLSLGRHIRRTIREALLTHPSENASEFMREAYREIMEAIEADDGSLELLIQASELREQARFEHEKTAGPGWLTSWRARKAGKAAVRSITPPVILAPKSIQTSS